MTSNSAFEEALTLQQQGKLDAAEAAFRKVLEAEPNNAEALGRLGALFVALGRREEGLNCLISALQADTNNEVLGVNVIRLLLQTGQIGRVLPVTQTSPGQITRYLLMAVDEQRDNVEIQIQIGHALCHAGLFRDGVETFRRILSRNPSQEKVRWHLRQALPMTQERAVVTDFLATNNLKTGYHIVVAGMRKSASTFVSNMMSAATGSSLLPLNYGFDATYDFIHVNNLITAYAANTVSHTHCPAHEENVQILQAFGIKPIVVVRNIFDNALSYMEWRNSRWTEGAKYQYDTFYKEYHTLDEETRTDFILDNYIIRQLEFLASWQYLAKQGRLDFKLVRYEDMVADKVAFFCDLLDWVGPPMPLKAVEDTLVTVEGGGDRNRFNKGRAGRGKEVFGGEREERIRRLTRYFPGVDFSPFGL